MNLRLIPLDDNPAEALDAVLTGVLPDTVAYVSVISTQGGGKTVDFSFGPIASGRNGSGQPAGQGAGSDGGAVAASGAFGDEEV